MILWSTVLVPFHSGYSFRMFPHKPKELLSIMFQFKFVDKILAVHIRLPKVVLLNIWISVFENELIEFYWTNLHNCGLCTERRILISFVTLQNVFFKTFHT